MKFKVYEVEVEGMADPLTVDLEEYDFTDISDSSFESAAHLWVCESSEDWDVNEEGELLVVDPEGKRKTFLFTYQYEPQIDVKQSRSR